MKPRTVRGAKQLPAACDPLLAGTARAVRQARYRLRTASGGAVALLDAILVTRSWQAAEPHPSEQRLPTPPQSAGRTHCGGADVIWAFAQPSPEPPSGWARASTAPTPAESDAVAASLDAIAAGDALLQATPKRPATSRRIPCARMWMPPPMVYFENQGKTGRRAAVINPPLSTRDSTE
jgi:hypothetical protein